MNTFSRKYQVWLSREDKQKSIVTFGLFMGFVNQPTKKEKKENLFLEILNTLKVEPFP